PFKTVISGDREAIGKLTMPDLEKLLAATLTGMSTEQFQAEVKTVVRRSERPALAQALQRTDLPTDAGGAEVSSSERLQDLHLHRRRPGFRARVCRADLWHPAGTDRRHHGRHDIWL